MVQAAAACPARLLVVQAHFSVHDLARLPGGTQIIFVVSGAGASGLFLVGRRIGVIHDSEDTGIVSEDIASADTPNKRGMN